jgi:lysophospholipase L1-like esterase
MKQGTMIAKRSLGLLALLLLVSRLSRAADAPAPVVRIALIGDSTVASYDQPPPDRPDLTGWGQVLGEFFDQRVEVRNFALSGRSSKSFLREGRWQPVLEAKPNYVFIQFGHNDQKKDDRGTEPDTEFQDFLRQYIDESRAAKVTPVLVTPVARRTFENGKATTSLSPYADAMKQVGREKSVPVIDLHTASFELFGRLGDEGSADLTASADDRSHFSRKGGRAMARLVAGQLPRALPELISYLSETSLSAEPGPAELPGLVRLALPPAIDACVGIETNVYFDNVMLVLNAANYAVDVNCAKGRQQQERWTFTPQPADVGEHPLQLEIRNERNDVIARGRSVVRVAPADAGEGKEVSLLMIGDSLTHASVSQQRIAALCEKSGNPKLGLVGSHGPGGTPGVIRHEGYGGWTALRFATHATGTPRQGDYAQRASPFLYPASDGKPALDFAAYCRDVSEGRYPGYVTIFLGPNDIFSFNDATIDGGIRTMLENYDLLIGMVHKAAPTTKVGVMLPVPPAASQDAFGANYTTGQTRWQYKRNQHRLLEKMLERYGGRDSERIQLVATHVNLDCVHNYPEESVNWNAATDIKGLRQNNGVHPAKSGYDQIGDSVYAWLKGNVK